MGWWGPPLFGPRGVPHPCCVPAGCRSWPGGRRGCTCAGPAPQAGRQRTRPPSPSRVGAALAHWGGVGTPNLFPTNTGILGHPPPNPGAPTDLSPHTHGHPPFPYTHRLPGTHHLSLKPMSTPIFLPMPKGTPIPLYLFPCPWAPPVSPHAHRHPCTPHLPTPMGTPVPPISPHTHGHPDTPDLFPYPWAPQYPQISPHAHGYPISPHLSLLPLAP